MWCSTTCVHTMGDLLHRGHGGTGAGVGEMGFYAGPLKKKGMENGLRSGLDGKSFKKFYPHEGRLKDQGVMGAVLSHIHWAPRTPPPPHPRPLGAWERVSARRPRRGEVGFREWAFVSPAPH